ncbi:MAG: twin-arginine translocase subunit TatC [Actinomycetota bacterium]
MARAEALPGRRFSFRRRTPVDPEGRMPVMDHLRELRRRIVISLAAFVVFSIAGFVFFAPLIDFLLEPLCGVGADKLGPQGCSLVFTKATGAFMVQMKVAALVGLFVSSPVWLYHLWAFTVPALSTTERRYSKPFVASSVLLFSSGAVLAYVTLPKALEFLLSFGAGRLTPLLQADTYLNLVMLVTLAFGAMFEVPLFLFFLGLVGVVTPQRLRRYRKHSIIAIAALSAVVTPSQDPITMLVMAVPVYGLYELNIWLLSIIDKRKKRKGAVT